MIFRINQFGIIYNADFPVLETDNVVAVRQKLVNIWPNFEKIDSKKIRLFYHDNILDFNNYLLRLVPNQNVTIDCVIDDSIDTNSSAILNVSYNRQENVIRQVQVEKKCFINNLREILTRIYQNNILTIFKDGKELVDDLSVCACDLLDNDRIIAVIEMEGRLQINNIFQSLETKIIAFVNVDLVMQIKNKIADLFNCCPKELLLFSNNDCLQDDKQLYRYDIGNDSLVTFCYYESIVNVERISESMSYGVFSVIFKARVISSGEEITIKKYNCREMSEAREKHALMIKELVTWNKIGGHDRIVKLKGLYKDPDAFYIGMEYMAGGSLNAYIQENWPITDESRIARLSRQIAEGLDHMHGMRVLYRDLRPSNVFLDANGDVKLSGFSLSKYAMGDNSAVLSQGFVQSKPGTFNYMAPEVYTGEDVGWKADIWSFGAILVEIVTGKVPFKDMNAREAGLAITRTGTIEYRDPPHGISDEFRDFIGCCLKMNPRDRLRAERLLQHNFLKLH